MKADAQYKSAISGRHADSLFRLHYFKAVSFATFRQQQCTHVICLSHGSGFSWRCVILFSDMWFDVGIFVEWHCVCFLGFQLRISFGIWRWNRWRRGRHASNMEDQRNLILASVSVHWPREVIFTHYLFFLWNSIYCFVGCSKFTSTVCIMAASYLCVSVQSFYSFNSETIASGVFVA